MIRNRNRDNSSGNNNSSGYIALLERIERLDFRTFQLCVTLWLGARGYESIRSLGRNTRQGRRKNGGADLLAQWPGVPESSVAIQIRHRRTPINGQTVDVLRGFMLRNHVAAGVIVANTSFSRTARSAASSFPGRPIAVVSSRALAWSMMELGLGVRQHAGVSRLDEQFFQSLERLRFASAPPANPAVRRLPPPTEISVSASTEGEGVGIRTKPERDEPLLPILIFILMVVTAIFAVLVGGAK